MTSNETTIDPNDDASEKKRKNRPGRSSRRRRRKARSIVFESSSNGYRGQDLEACVGIQSPTFDRNDTESTETSVVPIDRGYTLDGIKIRRREERLKRQRVSLRKSVESESKSESESPVRHKVQISDATNSKLDGQEETSSLDPKDEQALKSQLGYIPGNAICIAARLSPELLENETIQQEDGKKCSTHLNDDAMETTHDGKVKNDNELAPPSVVKLYPIAVRESYSGGKKDGRKFKGRKRGNARRSDTDRAANDENNNDQINHGNLQNEDNGRGTDQNTNEEAERGWFVDSFDANNNQDSMKVPIDTINTNSDNTASRQIIEPFPTLYWLTSPTLRTYISRIELSKTHNVQQMERRLQSSPSYLSQMRRAHKSYGEKRWELLIPLDRKNVLERNWGGAIDATRGVAGIRESRWHCVKCLHAHAAHYLAQVAEWEMEREGGVGDQECNREDLNLVGKWTMEAVFEALRSVFESCG